MTALSTRRRRRTIVMFAATMVGLLLIPVLGYVGAQAILDSTGGRDALADNLPVIEFPATPTAALVTTDPAGTLTSVTVFALDPSGVGGSAISVPVSADTGFTDDSRMSLQDVWEESGPDGLWPAIESLLVLTVNNFEDMGAPDVQTLLSPLGTIPVELPTAFEAADEDTTSVPAGASELSPETIAAILSTSAGDASESTRRPNLEAVWKGISEAVGDGVTATTGNGVAPVDPNATPTNFSEFMTHLFAGPVQSRGLDATPLTGEHNPEGRDIEEVSRSDALLVFGSIAPGAVSAPSPGLSFRIEAPPGYDAQVKRTIDKLLFLGGNVVSVDMTREPQPNTVFIVPDEINRAEAGQTNLIFGDFTFQEPEVRIDGVDLTVILGTDYLETAET